MNVGEGLDPAKMYKNLPFKLSVQKGLREYVVEHPIPF